MTSFNKFSSVTLLCTATIMSGCVSTRSVTTNQNNDDQLTCDSIATRIGEVQAGGNYARSKRGVSTENVAAAVFFWPALVSNNLKTTNMVNSMKERETTLTSLYNSEQCSETIPSYTNKEIYKKIKAGNTLEMFEKRQEKDG